MTRPRLVGLLVICALALGACGDESDDGGASDSDGGSSEEADLTAEEQEFADAFAAVLHDDAGFSVETDEADCMGTAVMSELGVAPFDDAGVTPADIVPGDTTSPGELLGDGAITNEQALSIIEVWGADCVDLIDMMVASAGSEMDLNPEGKACFTEGLATDDLGARLLAASFTTEDGNPDQDTLDAYLAMLEGCGDTVEAPTVDSISDALAADGTFTDEQARCLAQAVVDEIGPERMSGLFGTGTSFEGLDAAAQNEVTGALLAAAGTCDVPLSAFGG